MIPLEGAIAIIKPPTPIHPLLHYYRNPTVVVDAAYNHIIPYHILASITVLLDLSYLIKLLW